MKRRLWDWTSASMAKALICEVMRMKKIEAIIRPEKLHLLREKLDAKGFSGMTASARAWQRVVEQVQFVLRDKP